MVNFRTLLVSGLIMTVYFSEITAATITFNSLTPSENSITRQAWLSAIGISEPQHLVDFESSSVPERPFFDGLNISGISGLFPGGLIIDDTSVPNRIIIDDDFIGRSRVVGRFGIQHNERAFLRLDFSANPVDYLAFQDIDTTGVSGIITFEDGDTENISIEPTASSGFSAEFFGIFNNDMPRIAFVDLDANRDDRSWALDNIEYGLVPVPQTIVLLTSSLLGLLLVRRVKNIKRV